MSDATTTEGCDPVATLLDVFVFAPISLVLDAATVGPDLATRGRQHAANARVLGEMAVKQGRRRLEDLSQSPSPDPAPHEASTDPVPGPEPADAGTDAEPTTEVVSVPPADLAIVDYDLLAASQVVQRLGALAPDELESVRLYETAKRGRRTILTKIARLQG